MGIQASKAITKPAPVIERGLPQLPRPTWAELNPDSRSSFVFHYKRELHRLGLLKVAWLGPKAVTFDCTEGETSILAAVHYWLAETGLFKKDPEEDKNLSRSPSAMLSFQVSPHEPDMVTVEWGGVVERYRSHPLVKSHFSTPIVAALRTFLEHNADYRRHRESRLAKREQERLSQRSKSSSPESIAAACIAWDWRKAGLLLSDLKPTLADSLAVIGGHKDDWRNDIRRMKELHERAGLRPTE